MTRGRIESRNRITDHAERFCLYEDFVYDRYDNFSYQYFRQFMRIVVYAAPCPEAPIIYNSTISPQSINSVSDSLHPDPPPLHPYPLKTLIVRFKYHNSSHPIDQTQIQHTLIHHTSNPNSLHPNSTHPNSTYPNSQHHPNSTHPNSSHPNWPHPN